MTHELHERLHQAESYKSERIRAMTTGVDPREEFSVLGYVAMASGVEEETLTDLRNEIVGDLVGGFYSGIYSGEDYWSYVPESGGLTEGRPEVLYRIHNLENQPGAPTVAKFFENGPLHDIAALVLGEPARATVCAAVVKLPERGGPVPWHRDRDHEGLRPGRAVNVSLNLHESTAGNGCLQVIPGSQSLAEGVDIETWRATRPVSLVPVRSGDVTVHDVRLVHGSGPNVVQDICVRIVVEFRAASLPMRTLLGPV